MKKSSPKKRNSPNSNNFDNLGLTGPPPGFTDNRQEAQEQRQRQQAADQSDQVQNLMGLQAGANGGQEATPQEDNSPLVPVPGAQPVDPNVIQNLLAFGARGWGTGMQGGIPDAESVSQENTSEDGFAYRPIHPRKFGDDENHWFHDGGQASDIDMDSESGDDEAQGYFMHAEAQRRRMMMRMRMRMLMADTISSTSTDSMDSDGDSDSDSATVEMDFD